MSQPEHGSAIRSRQREVKFLINLEFRETEFFRFAPEHYSKL